LSQATSFQCEICRDTGFAPARKDGVPGVVECECRRNRITESRLATIYDQLGAYSEARLDRFDPKNYGQRDAHAVITSDPFASYHLWGGYDRGKTWLLVAQYRFLMKKGVPCQFRTSRQLVDELKEAESKDGRPSIVMELASKSQKFHFFWDDCEKAALRTDFRMESLFELVDAIRRRNLGISLTSNLPLVDQTASPANPTDLRFKLSNPIVARLHGMCQSILL